MSDPTVETVPPPVRHRVRVALAPADAFALFTAGIARWWPLATHSCTGLRDARVEFDGRAGGAVIETGPDGRQHVWGTLIDWQPGRRFAMHWHPGRDAAEATRLEVRFEPDGDGCAVEVLHDGWQARGAAGPEVRDGYAEGWPLVLQPFVSLAAQVRS